MTSERAGNPLFAGHLENENIDSSEPALATVPRVVAGNARAYYEHMKGSSPTATPISGQVPCISRGPRGLYGEDHSGVGWGATIKHTVWQINFGYPAGGLGTGDYVGPNQSTSARTPPQINRDFTSTQTYIGMDATFLFMVPACYPGGTYETLQAQLVYHVATNRSTTNAEVRIYTDAMGGLLDSNTIGGHSLQLDLAGDDAGFDIVGGTVRVIPGKINRMRIKFFMEHYAPTDGTSCAISLVSLALHNNT